MKHNKRTFEMVSTLKIDNEERFRLFADQVTECILIYDATGQIMDANLQACKSLGYSSAELLKMRLHDLIIDVSAEMLTKQWQVLNSEKTLTFETSLRNKDGYNFPVTARLVLNKTTIGKLISFYASPISKDALSHQRAHEALLLSNLQLAEAQAVAHMGNWNWDIRDGSLQWSDEIYRIFGFYPQEFKPSYEAFIELVHPEDRQSVQIAVNRALDAVQPYSIDHRICQPDGSTRFVHEQGDVRFDDKGNPLHMIGTVHDITKRYLAQQNLLKSEIRFRATFDQAAVGMALVSLDSRWLKVNGRFCQFIGYEHDELNTKSINDVSHPDDQKINLRLMKELLVGTREYHTTEKRYQCKNGRITWGQLTVSLVRNEKQNPEYFIFVIQDINARKEAESRLLHTLMEKDTILRELHHRVKNNMQVVSSLLSLQTRYAHNQTPQQMLQESRQRIRAMALIHERLYSAADLSAVDFLDYLRYLGERLTRLYHETGVSLKIQVSGEPLRLAVDQALPCALISNELITNAIRHAYPAEQHERLIEIRISNIDSESAQIVFKDYGCGIDQKKLSEEPHSLGLIIIRALTRQLAGKIHLESVNGTIARLIFPTNTINTPRNNSTLIQLQQHNE